ncbi:conjugal transfer protein TraK [Maribacter sp. 2210JD10-5]|uniref:conjugal transfer protein TraK n=1 Tax=Maribacter sp. 2210JD10-5 TaxID=3386272 RepID=UPI0039BCD16A
MKTPYTNIYTVLKTNRFVVITVVLGAMLTSLISGLMVFNIHKKAINNAFAIKTDGEVIPLEMVNQKENLMVEALDHLKLFHEYFYGIDANNYESNLAKALWLGKSSVDNVYRQKKAEGVYNRILQYSLTQRVLSVESEIDLSEEPFPFQSKTIFEINRGATTDKYELITTGDLIFGNRHFPNNTHGLLITNYYEKTLKKINDDR